MLPESILQKLFADDTVNDVDDLLKFLNRRVLPCGEEYSGVEVVAVDSIQGSGLSSNASKKYGALYESRLAFDKLHRLIASDIALIKEPRGVTMPKGAMPQQSKQGC